MSLEGVISLLNQFKFTKKQKNTGVLNFFNFFPFLNSQFSNLLSGVADRFTNHKNVYSGLRIRIHMDPHYLGKLRIRIRIGVKSWTRNRIKVKIQEP
jgi:hypothetical protein